MKVPENARQTVVEGQLQPDSEVMCHSLVAPTVAKFEVDATDKDASRRFIFNESHEMSHSEENGRTESTQVYELVLPKLEKQLLTVEQQTKRS